MSPCGSIGKRANKQGVYIPNPIQKRKISELNHEEYVEKIIGRQFSTCRRNMSGTDYSTSIFFRASVQKKKGESSY